jgi:hypothetical protein
MIRDVSGSRAPRNVGSVPRQRATARPPHQRPVARVPHGETPVARVKRAPQERGIGAVPNPRKPKLVRAALGGALGDLFAIFRDLPRPSRPAPRLVRKRIAVKGRRP